MHIVSSLGSHFKEQKFIDCYFFTQFSRKEISMLIKCPECELQVSDKALSCPHCGYPMQKELPQVRSKNKPKRKRLPNGFGSITELKNRNLRNPFWARVCVGKDPFGKPILKPLKPEAYFSTYNDAYSALVEYNRNPYDLESDITVQELYNKWSDAYFDKLESDASIRTITSAWAYCSSVYNMRAKDIRARHIKGCMEEGFRIEYRGKNKGQKIYATAGTKARIKSLFNLMLDYGVEYEIVDKNYARTFEISGDITKEIKASKKDHIAFSDDEIKKLWNNVEKVKFVDWILIQSYMGWRPQELAILELDEVDLENWTITGGMKTDAGKQRTVPIHSKIQYLVKQNYEFALSIGSKRLFNDKGQTHSGKWELTYDKYANRFNKVIESLKLNPEHRPHDPRGTFITRIRKCGVEKDAVKALVGHKASDITESAYTKRDIEWLRKDIEKLTYAKKEEPN